MNITEAIGREMGITKILDGIPQIQVYANVNTYQYQWRDSRFSETSDVWNNKSYDTRRELREALRMHLENKGDLDVKN